MECTFCPGHKATCHLTKLVNGKSVEVHVCEKCIPELAQGGLVDFDIWESVAKLAASKGKPDPSKAIEQEAVEISAKSLLIRQSGSSNLECPACGFTSAEVRKTGRLGCPQCYEVFSTMLHDVLTDCQKSQQHTGKIPITYLQLRRNKIEDDLRRAVAEERFEEAAVLRDQLNRLEA